MSELARKAKLSPLIRDRAKSLTCNLPQKDRWGEISAVFQYVQQGVRYLRDPRDVETLVEPETLIDDLFPAGDCDDKSLLLAALLESIGFSTRFCAVGFREPGVYSHVFVDVQYGRGNSWLSLDPTENQPMGWRPPGICCVMVRNN